MSEIEKMYKNCNIKPKQEGYCDWDSDCPYPDIINNDCGDGCPYWKYEDEAEYPPFTAEEQLALIKLLSYYYNITISKNFENNYTFQCEGDDVRRYVFTSGQDFAEQLASFVNMCYELLPEEERKQVKEILE